MNSNNWYPDKVAVGSDGTSETYKFMQNVFSPQQCFHYAEFVIYQGDTARNVIELFPNVILHLFDFHETIENVRSKLDPLSRRIFYYGNTQKFNDSYNWQLLKLIEAQQNGYLFDYVFLDGAHTLAVDGLTFFLCDKLLKPGGFMDFDDYSWRLRGSSLDPQKVPVISDQYTDEQIDSFQVKMIVDILVKSDNRYKEVLANKVYQKTL